MSCIQAVHLIAAGKIEIKRFLSSSFLFFMGPIVQDLLNGGWENCPTKTDPFRRVGACPPAWRF